MCPYPGALLTKFVCQMFADLHHLHQFISLEQGGSVTTVSNVAGTGAGEADIYFGVYRTLSDALIFPVPVLIALVVFQVLPT